MTTDLAELNRRAARVPAQVLHELVQRPVPFETTPEIAVVTLPDLNRARSEFPQPPPGAGPKLHKSIIRLDSVLNDQQRTHGKLLMPVCELVRKQAGAVVLVCRSDSAIQADWISLALADTLTESGARVLWVGDSADDLGNSLFTTGQMAMEVRTSHGCFATSNERLDILPHLTPSSGEGTSTELSSSLGIQRLQLLREMYAHVIVSCGAHHQEGLNKWRRMASGALLLVQRHASDQEQAQQAVARIAKAEIPLWGCIALE